jgi:GAF domain-containing protein
LTHAYGVSADGDTIVGRGFNPDGFIEAFRITGVHAYLATVPEPSEVAVLAGLATLAAVALQRRRKGLDTA